NVTDDGPVVDLWRKRRQSPATPAKGNVAALAAAIQNPLCDLPSDEFGLDSIDAADSTRTAIIGRELPVPPFSMGAGPAVRRRRSDFSLRPEPVQMQRFRQLVIVDFGAPTRAQPVLPWQWGIAWQRQPFGVEIVVDLAVAGRIPAVMVSGSCGLFAPLVIA